MGLGIVLYRERMDEGNAFMDALNPENNGNSFPNVELVDDSGNIVLRPETDVDGVADYADLVPRDLERLRAMQLGGGLEGRELFDWLEDNKFDGYATIYEIVENPQGEKQVSSMSEVFAKEGLSRKETEDIQ